MNDIVNSMPGLSQLDSNRIESGHLHTARPVGQMVKQLMNTKQQTGLAGQLSPVAPITMESIIKSTHSNSVKDLNLIMNNINQLTTEIVQKIYNQIKSNNRIRSYPESKEDKCDEETCNEDIDGSSDTYIIDQYIIMILVRIHEYLQDNNITQSYKFIIVYQILQNSSVCFKQVLTMIPFEYAIPMDGISEITTCERNGINTKKQFLSKLISGGFRYTKDWLSLCVIEEMQNQTVQLINICSDHGNLRGFLTNYNLDIAVACHQTRFHMHIQDFVNNW
jgi:hypothetical protein